MRKGCKSVAALETTARIALTLHRLVTTEHPFKHSSLRVMESGWRIIGQGCPGCLENCCFVEKLLKCCKAHIGRAASHSRRSERLDLWRKPLRRGCELKAMPPGSSALLLEQLAIVYSLPHWHSKCILTVLSHNQQVAIFMHVQVEGKLFMGEWT